jgi:hypothetical protein
MTRPTFTRQSRGDVDLSDVVPWLNVSGESIPAHAVIQLRTNFASGLSQASKPDSSSGIFFTNGPASVGVDGKGESLLWNRPRRVMVNETLAVGDEVGPVEGSWEMTTGGSGFRVIHQDDSGIATVLSVGGGKLELFHGVIVEQCDPTCSTYKVQRIHRYLIAGCEDCEYE